jgi:hypothetical protein
MKKHPKTKLQQKNNITDDAETEIPEEETIPSEEISDPEISDPEIDDPDFEDNEILPKDEEFVYDASPIELPENGTSEPNEKSYFSPKQIKKALKRALENKTYSLDRETTKVKEWRSQAKERDEKATAEYDKRKKEAEEILKKAEERFNKRIARTKKWWREYADNHEQNKIKKLQDDIALLQAELKKQEESAEPVETAEEVK